MASFTTFRFWVLAAMLILIFVFCNMLGNAEEDFQDKKGNEVDNDRDPAQIVAEALLCFNAKYAYRSCEESYRLTQNGNLNVPKEKTDEYCNGPCLTETHLVLNCIDNIFKNFVFYNKATIQDVRDTVQAACSYGPQRGNFDVAEHIKTEESKANKAVKQILVVFGLMITGLGVLL